MSSKYQLCLENFRHLDYLMVTWMFAETTSHWMEDYEKRIGKPLDGNENDFIQDRIKSLYPESEIYIFKKGNPFDLYILTITNQGAFHSFAGTHSAIDDWSDWKCNSKIIMNKDGMHTGWYEAMLRFMDEISSFIPQIKNMRNVFTGHSQGGPLSLYLARQLKICYGIEGEVWTFESPRVGNEDFCKSFPALGIKVVRVWSPGDPAVIHFKLFGRHYGQSIKLPVVTWLQYILFLRLYAHSYSIVTKGIKKYFDKRKMFKESLFCNYMLEFTNI